MGGIGMVTDISKLMAYVKKYLEPNHPLRELFCPEAEDQKDEPIDQTLDDVRENKNEIHGDSNMKGIFNEKDSTIGESKPAPNVKHLLNLKMISKNKSSWFNPPLRGFESFFLKDESKFVGNVDLDLMLSPQMFEMCEEHMELLSIGLKRPIETEGYHRMFISYLANEMIDRRNIERKISLWEAFHGEIPKVSKSIDRRHMKSHMPSEVTVEYSTMNVAISITGLSQETIDMLNMTAHILNVVGINDVIRLGIYLIFECTQYFSTRYHPDMGGFMQEPIAKLTRLMDDKYRTPYFEGAVCGY